MLKQNGNVGDSQAGQPMSCLLLLSLVWGGGRGGRGGWGGTRQELLQERHSISASFVMTSLHFFLSYFMLSLFFADCFSNLGQRTTERCAIIIAYRKGQEFDFLNVFPSCSRSIVAEIWTFCVDDETAPHNNARGKSSADRILRVRLRESNRVTILLDSSSVSTAPEPFEWCNLSGLFIRWFIVTSSDNAVSAFGPV